MTEMTDEAAAAFADSILDRQARARERMHGIMEVPEAEGRESVAFALACRQDIPVGRARTLLAEAPEMTRIADITAWVEAIPTRPPLEIVSQ
jgi:hypothetical protein